MFQRIVVPLDGSACAQKAYDAALALVAATPATVYLCSAIDPLTLTEGMMPGGISERILSEARDAALALLAEAAKLAAARGVASQTQLLEGETPYEIVQYAKQVDADCIAMGTHGRSGLKRLMLGSVTESVLRQAPCAVLALRDA